MKVDLTPYRDKRICVALSGGRDSMALIDYLSVNAAQYGITLSAVNCDHCMRGEESVRDSRFVADYCREKGIPLIFFRADGRKFTDERSAREWRLSCFDSIISSGRADYVATAHHMNDNAETVLFNLARGSSLAGLAGISESTSRSYIRPFIGVSGEEIENYVRKRNISYVTDSTNLTDDYTRNKIRHGVLPALESAVSGAVGNIYRFSRLAAEDEEYLSRVASGYVSPCRGGYVVSPCPERVIFRRAAYLIINGRFNKKDYTSAQFERLYRLQYGENGKKFLFLGLSAVKQPDGVAIVEAKGETGFILPFSEVLGTTSKMPDGEKFTIAQGEPPEITSGSKPLVFDLDEVPPTAVVRTRRAGDRFTKFGGGSKSLGDYLTDKKIPQSIRDRLPLIADGADVLAVGGVEISDRIKITKNTVHKAVFICPNASEK